MAFAAEGANEIRTELLPPAIFGENLVGTLSRFF
jgi:hypothetical protein